MHCTRRAYHEEARRYHDILLDTRKCADTGAYEAVRRVMLRNRAHRVRLTWIDRRPVYTVDARPRRGVATPHRNALTTRGAAPAPRWRCRVARGGGSRHGGYVHRQFERWHARRINFADRRETCARTPQPCTCLVRLVLPTLQRAGLIVLASELPVWNAARCTAVDVVATPRDGRHIVLIEMKTSRTSLTTTPTTRAEYFSQLLCTRDLFCHSSGVPRARVECLLLEINPHRTRWHRPPPAENVVVTTTTKAERPSTRRPRNS